MCGEHLFTVAVAMFDAGSSPHVRGAREGPSEPERHGGIIPACAGSTSFAMSRLIHHRDHPRMCGEHRSQLRICAPVEGSSPHVRGARDALSRPRSPAGIIPACAGSTSTRPSWSARQRDHPRMCGEHVAADGQAVAFQGSSPHVRGAHTMQGTACSLLGIIPACAGSTSAPRPC